VVLYFIVWSVRNSAKAHKDAKEPVNEGRLAEAVNRLSRDEDERRKLLLYSLHLLRHLLLLDCMRALLFKGSEGSVKVVYSFSLIATIFLGQGR
jgi:hypothetical protein